MAHEHEYWVYILSSKSRTLYVGVTNDLVRRVAEHKSGKGAVFTRRYKVTRLVYADSTGDINETISMEKQIKGWLRVKKIALIESQNPEWNDLSEEW